MHACTRGVLAIAWLCACSENLIEASTAGDGGRGTSGSTGRPSEASDGPPATTSSSGSADGTRSGGGTEAGSDESAADESDTGGATTVTSTTRGETDTTTDTGACVEMHEPNDSEIQAVDVGSVDCNGASIEITSVADPASTTDWFSYFGMHDEAACGTNGLPVVTVTDGSPLEVCAFAVCPGGGGAVESCPMGVAMSSPDGRPGCCGTDIVALDVNCPPTDESATVLVSVDTATASCLEYTLMLEY